MKKLLGVLLIVALSPALIVVAFAALAWGLLTWLMDVAGNLLAS